MRTVFIHVVIVALAVRTTSAQSVTAAAPPPVRPLATLSEVVGETAPALGGKRIYYLTGSNELRMYDAVSKRSVNVASGMMRRLAVSMRGDLITFVRAEQKEGPTNVWTLPLDPGTGLAAGPSRRASVGPGDFPSISGDSKWIAFVADTDAGRLVVIPAHGGNERTVYRAPITTWRIPVTGKVIPFGLWRPLWSADGSSIYFGGVTDSKTWSLQRIASAGGHPEILAQVGSTWLDLSPDGRTLVFDKGAENGELTIADANGRTLGTIPQVFGIRWLSSTEIVASSSHRAREVRTLRLADGTSREVLPDSEDVRQLSWSPNGTRFAAVGAIPTTWGYRARLLIADADGGHRRSINLPDDWATAVEWSPDGERVVVAIPFGGRDGALSVDAATGHVDTLRTRGDVRSLRWTSDSRHVLYSPFTPLSKPAQVRAVGIDGSERLVREFASPDTVVGVHFLSDTSVLLGTLTDTYLGSLADGRTLELKQGSERAPLGASLDGHFIALLKPPATSSEAATVNIFNTTGNQLASVPFPSGQLMVRRFIFTPDNKHIIASIRNSGGACCMLFEGSSDGSPARKLGEVTFDNNGAPALDLSPDGKMLLYTTGTAYITKFQAIDVSSIVRNAKAP